MRVHVYLSLQPHVSTRNAAGPSQPVALHGGGMTGDVCAAAWMLESTPGPNPSFTCLDARVTHRATLRASLSLYAVPLCCPSMLCLCWGYHSCVAMCLSNKWLRAMLLHAARCASQPLRIILTHHATRPLLWRSAIDRGRGPGPPLVGASYAGGGGPARIGWPPCKPRWAAFTRNHRHNARVPRRGAPARGS